MLCALHFGLPLLPDAVSFDVWSVLARLGPWLFWEFSSQFVMLKETPCWVWTRIPLDRGTLGEQTESSTQGAQCLSLQVVFGTLQ